MKCRCIDTSLDSTMPICCLCRETQSQDIPKFPKAAPRFSRHLQSVISLQINPPVGASSATSLGPHYPGSRQLPPPNEKKSRAADFPLAAFPCPKDSGMVGGSHFFTSSGGTLHLPEQVSRTKVRRINKGQAKSVWSSAAVMGGYFEGCVSPCFFAGDMIRIQTCKSF